ncbi:AAA family ATPase [Dysosmobacter sp.]|uniref:AAA family ATPase n=1 Tax=Dysosmobacter sp. TaxID=2591382 RepID=UPI002A95ADDA|nr:AAA family ATPase [Dysosmobacter sp.]MCI6054670.1 AAA family ATPase [Dysosmobacter sp.]MDY5508827.1 AAA family ATPase [Dysosmobacter sp.]
MTATFGQLQGRTLELQEGLNILQSPNESGKSTWCAFLASMLYGINSRERDRAGFIADKNRYAPWSGAAMSGRLDCGTDLGELTLTRTTRRQTSPMGEFSAVYAGTGDAVPDLTGRTCGETLLGVSREVFERSAFIRQSGLAVTQDAGLERRIAALISAGEEDTSYTEAADALKKQLNRRRHNKTGLLPALEAELAETERQLSEIGELEGQLSQARAQAEELAAREASLIEELAAHDRWEAAQKRQALSGAEAAARETAERASALRRRAEEERLPENDTIARLRGAIVNLQTVRRSVEKARAERDEAMKALLKAEANLGESPFAGQTPDSARKEAQQAAPSDKVPGAVAVRELAIFFLFLAAAGGVFALLYARTSTLDLPLMRMVPWLLPGAAAAVVAGAGTYISRLYRTHTLEAMRHTALTKRFGTADPDAIAGMADTYCKLYEAREAAQEAVNAKTAAADTLYSSLSSNEQGILLEVRRFAPAAFDIPTADSLLRQCAVRRRELAEAETAARDARLRWEVQSQQLPQAEEAELPAPPVRNREAVTAELEGTREALAAAKSAADRLTGRLHAVGDPAVLASVREEQLAQKEQLEGEYAALQLALEALDTANTTLQNRFSPELGRRAAEIFSGLTGGRYGGVVLDRSFRLSAEPAGEGVYREAELLSAGALDQLYLAVRLAICDLVLPPEKTVPIVLDDALANFDDSRCAAALRYLKEAARGRQILLFTCHSREADFFTGDDEVSVQRLTAGADRV